MGTKDIRIQLNTWLRKIPTTLKNVSNEPLAMQTPFGKQNSLSELFDELPHTDDERTLVICQARNKGNGEDFCLSLQHEGRVFFGAFDGCGGSGARVYPSFGGHTGAWVASRAASVAAREWFLEKEADEAFTAHVDRALQACRGQEPGGQTLMGSLSREFPTTVAAFVKDADSPEVTFFWCGDSRCYILDAGGLHQITPDDTNIKDAMCNLREDAPMTNVACASRPFEVHCAKLRIEKPSLIFAATDGCFGYLPSPMSFERLLLDTMGHATDMRNWKKKLDRQFSTVSGDDYTLVALMQGFGSFREMKQTLTVRFADLDAQYPADTTGEDALFAQWEQYRAGYESMMIDLSA